MKIDEKQKTKKKNDKNLFVSFCLLWNDIKKIKIICFKIMKN